MSKWGMFVFTLAAATVLAEPTVYAPQALSSEAKGRMEQALKGCALAKPLQKRKVLVFWRCEGFAHKEAIDHANALFTLISSDPKGVLSADLAGDYAALTAENLKKYDALIMNNTTGMKTWEHTDLEATLLDFVRSGKGYVALHGGADNFGRAPALCQMLGGLFDGHPWGSGGTWSFKVDDAASAITAPLGTQPFPWGDEIYQHKLTFCDRSVLHVLVSLNMADPATQASNADKQNNTVFNDYPVSWIRQYGKGRVFFTSFGHDGRAYCDAKILSHILLGVQYATGDVKADATPAGFSDAQMKALAQTSDEKQNEAWAWITAMMTATFDDGVKAKNVSKLEAVLASGTATAAAKAAITRALIPYRTKNLKSNAVPREPLAVTVGVSTAEPLMGPKKMSEAAILALFKKLDDPATEKEAQWALITTAEPQTERVLIAAAGNDAAKLAKVFEVIADRNLKRAFSTLLAYTESSVAAEVRAAAWKSLRKVVAEEHFQLLINHLARVDVKDANMAEQAIMSTFRFLDRDVRNAAILKAYQGNHDPATQAVMFSLIQRFKETCFIPAVLATARKTGADQEDALRLLASYGSWDAAMVQALLAYASTEKYQQQVAGWMYRSQGTALFDTLYPLFNDATYGGAAKAVYRKAYERNFLADAAKPTTEIPQSQLKAKASHNERDVQRAFDKNLDTRWASNKSSEPGMWFEVDVGSVTYITELVINTEKSKNDTPNGCEVRVSSDGKTWSDVVCTADGKLPARYTLAINRQARFIRVTTTGGRNGLFWSIHELSVRTGVSPELAQRIRTIAESIK